MQGGKSLHVSPKTNRCVFRLRSRCSRARPQTLTRLSASGTRKNTHAHTHTHARAHTHTHTPQREKSACTILECCDHCSGTGLGGGSTAGRQTCRGGVKHMVRHDPFDKCKRSEWIVCQVVVVCRLGMTARECIASVWGLLEASGGGAGWGVRVRELI